MANISRINAKKMMILGVTVLFSIISYGFSASDWGFFGHRRINRMAVFTLPVEIMPFFRKHVEYLTDHAVDPDKRRYATRHEAVRHYIDIDHWGTYPFDNVPRDWATALLRYGEIILVPNRPTNDTVRIQATDLIKEDVADPIVLLESNRPNVQLALPLAEYRAFWVEYVLPQYYEEEWTVPVETVAELFELTTTDFSAAYVIDHFSEYGIVPYHLEKIQRDLTRAFEQKNPERILRICAEMGHYIGDAHVPLHTTENYNGALTDQVGIHAFWESRLPELFADKNYDYFVGRAEYIADKRDFFWTAVLDSHALLDSVLLIEKRLSQTIPTDQQYCFEERNSLSVRTQCEAYARAYHEAMDGMVERRMRDAILAIGSCWFTAWVDAGQPDLSRFFGKEYRADAAEQEALNRSYQGNPIKGRDHGS